MTQVELQAWWPEMAVVVLDLQRIGQPVVADLLIDAVSAAATSGEILCGVGVVLRDHRALRSQVDAVAAIAWDAVMADVDRAYPGASLTRQRGNR